MKFKMKQWLHAFFTFLLAFSGLTVVPLSASANTIAPYPMPSIYSNSSVYSLNVNTKTIPVVSYESNYDYAEFSMSVGTTTVEVTALGQASISSYSISPKKLGLSGTISGNKLTFTINTDEYLIVEINGMKKRLVIAADPGEVGAPASSGTGIFNVKNAPYNADSSGGSMATTAIQNAINDASSYGGSVGGQGIVYVPVGVYLVGNLQLKSNVGLYLLGGSVLRSTGNPADYTVNWHKNSQGNDETWWIYTATGSNNIKVFGRGTLDGNGLFSTTTYKFGNDILAPMNTSNFTLDGLILRDSGSWALTPARSDNLTFKNFKIFNRFDHVGENDGIDVMESQTATVQHAIGIGLDDPFSSKTWMQTIDMFVNMPGVPEQLNNVLFDDLISWTYCYGYKVGQGVFQNQTGVTFQNSVVYNAAVGIGINDKYGTGAATNVTFNNIDIEKLEFTNANHRTWALFDIENADGSGGGPINNLTVKNINVRDKGVTAAILKGYSSAKMISGITFDNIVMPGSSTPASNLYQMNMTDRDFFTPVTIFPVQTSEPPIAVTNPGFETGSSSGWSQYSNIGTNYRLESGGAHSGTWKLAHYNATSAYKQKTYQSQFVPNGTYKLTVWMRSTGGQNALLMYATNYGAPEMDTFIGATSAWTQYTIDNIPVTNGHIEFGIWSDANANNWAAMDDFVLIKK